MRHSRQHGDRERGAGLVEYALVAGLIALVAVVAVAAFGSGVSSSITASADAVGDGSSPTTTVPVNQEKNVETEEAGDVRFEEAGGEVRFGDISPADGWSAKVTKDNGSRATVRLTNDDSGERVVVTGWLNKKGKLKTRIR